MKFIIAIVFFLTSVCSYGQPGLINGMIASQVVADANGIPLAGATVTIIIISDTTSGSQTQVTGEDGRFLIIVNKAGIYSLDITAVGFAGFSVDSISVRPERQSFNIPTIRLLPATAGLSTVVVYAEKPLYENKDGKLTFNAGESAMSEGSSATDLLKQTPLITVDEDGRVLMKGKEVKILVDDKPVNMDAAQLAGLLESMPGSMIEKIEVLTTPPPQYATERGGVINIVTKKGKAGNSGRLNASYGTKGESAISASYNVKKKKISFNGSVGFSYGAYYSDRLSQRENFYKDSSNYFNTYGDVTNDRLRPFLKASADYALTALQTLTLTGFINGNNNSGNSFTRYQNINRYQEIYKHSYRDIRSRADVFSDAFNVAYIKKWKNPAKLLRIDGGISMSTNNSDRNFYQSFLTADSLPTGTDSTQEQLTQLDSKSYTLNFNYDQPLQNKKWFLNVSGSASHAITENELLTRFLLKPDNVFVQNELLSNHFFFYEDVVTLRSSLRYQLSPDFTGYAGLQLDHTRISFDIDNDNNHYPNQYYSSLPFANITYKWHSGYSLTGSYKRSITRPGINQLNPSVDYSDPYNTRFGNPFLLPFFSDNMDLTAGYWNKKFSVNLSAGYNILSQVYSTIRSLQADGKTITTWQNLGGRKEYESSVWGNWSVNKKLKLTGSAGYTYNVYSQDSKVLRKYKDGGSVTTSLNGNYVFDKIMNCSASFTYNRIANPQGNVRAALISNFAIQRKFFERLLSVTLQLTDPWGDQQLVSNTVASNYYLRSLSSNNTRNIKLSAGYTIRKKIKKSTAVKKV